MKKILLVILVCLSGSQLPLRANAQAAEAAQLALNIEKLAQLKSILTTLEKGYVIVSKGYGTVKSLTEGNFSLHKVFLDGLMQVSPAVKKYKKVATIIEYQIQLIKECKIAARRFTAPDLFGSSEISYMVGVFDNVATGSLKNLDELVNVVTAGSLRMSDDERLSSIDKIYADMEDRLTFVREFGSSCSLMALSRSKAKNQVTGMERLYGIQNLR
ncbi:TerB family tellurite resistance protein [Chitinophaga defluvii]|uniref:TerB family tellurite resistance protein n=1 Tax=Chitinophaga defluvii TaxID=3163343 RepID=A0ABV2TCG1_9BACT